MSGLTRRMWWTNLKILSSSESQSWDPNAGKSTLVNTLIESEVISKLLMVVVVLIKYLYARRFVPCQSVFTQQGGIKEGFLWTPLD
jgi:hypothetical protein